MRPRPRGLAQGCGDVDRRCRWLVRGVRCCPARGNPGVDFLASGATATELKLIVKVWGLDWIDLA